MADASTPPGSVPRTIVWVALAAAWPAVVASFIVRFGVDTPYMDDWEMVPVLEKAREGELTAADLLSQHNEGRPLVPRLLFLLLANLSGWDLRWQMGLTLLLASATTVLLVIAGRRGLPAAAGLAWPLVTGTSLILHSLTQWGNWLWGVMGTIYLPFLCLAGGLAVASTGIPLVWRTAACIACAIAGVFSHPNGILLFALLPIAVAGMDDEGRVAVRRTWWWWVIAALGVSVVYFAGYAPIPGHPDPSLALRHPLHSLRFLAVLAGAPVAAALAGALASVPLAAAVGAVQWLVLATLAILAARNPDRGLRRAATPWLIVAAFTLLTATMVTAGRVGFGPAYALDPRYVTYALPLPLCIAWLSAILLTRVDGSPRRRPSLSAAAAGAVILTVVPHLAAIATVPGRMPEKRHARLAGKAVLAMAPVAPDERLLARLVYPDQTRLARLAGTADRLGLLSPPLVRDQDVRPIAGEEGGASGAWGVVSGPDGSTLLRGSAWLPRRGEPADLVLLTCADGAGVAWIRGLAFVDGTPSEAVDAVLAPAARFPGWEAPLPDGTTSCAPGSVSAWAYDAIEGRAFPLAGAGR